MTRVYGYRPPKNFMAHAIGTLAIAGLGAIHGPSSKSGCFVCGSAARRSTGECDACGSYVCRDCGRLHLGEADRPCPGRGVPVPKVEVRP